MKYESSILKRLIDTYGVIGNPRYLSEIIKEFIVCGKELYPQLLTYQSDWLAHIDEFGLTPEYTVSYTGQHIYAPNTKEKPVKSAILKGSTKYRDIDTGDILDTFDETKNLELVSVKMPVLTTSNEDGTKTNILTVNEEVELRGIGDVQDELNLLTGELTQRVGEIVLDGSENWMTNKETETHASYYLKIESNMKPLFKCMTNSLTTYGWGDVKELTEECFWSFTTSYGIIVSKAECPTVEGFKQKLSRNPVLLQYELNKSAIKTVDLTIHDKDHQKVERLTSFEGGTHFTTSSQDGSLLPTLDVDVVTDLEEVLMVCSSEGNTM